MLVSFVFATIGVCAISVPLAWLFGWDSATFFITMISILVYPPFLWTGFKSWYEYGDSDDEKEY